MKIVFTFNPPKEWVNALVNGFPQMNFGFFHNAELAKEEFKDAEVIVTYGEDLNDEHIVSAEKLKWIMVTSAGLELMPLSRIKEKNILITNARGIHKIPMAEYTIGLLLDNAKKFQLLGKLQQAQEWNKGIQTNELCGQSIMILGAGAIGQEIARLAKAFRMTVIGVNSSGRILENFDDMYTLDTAVKAFGVVDYVVSVLPSTPGTVNFYKKEDFQLMKKSAVFINIGRGDVVDEAVLIHALKQNEIAHAYLDVFKTEPLPSGHPFWKIDNVTITPHISSTTKNYLPRALEIFKFNLHTYINNNENFINAIDPERGY